MRFLSTRALAAALIIVIATLLADVHSLSIKGKKHFHFNSLKHGKEVLAAEARQPAAAAAAVATLNERDVLNPYLTVELINNLDSNDVHAYIQSKLADEEVLITADGGVFQPRNSFPGVAMKIPQSAKCGIPLGSRGTKVSITMPMQMEAGRIYIADGELDLGKLQNGAIQHPAYGAGCNTSFGVVEANQPGNTIFVNPSYVDFVGLPYAIETVDATGKIANMSGLPADGVKRVCALLAEEEKKDGYPWASELCLKDSSGDYFRVLSPEHRPEHFSSYFDGYIDQVWDHLSRYGIQFDLQDSSSIVNCWMEGDVLACDRNAARFDKPKSNDIWGCNAGTFSRTTDKCHDAIGARLCAAFHRATLLLPGGALQPSLGVDKYYPSEFCHNKYARIVHEVQINHLGYTFPYDDVKQGFENEVSGTFTCESPKILRIFVGGRDESHAQQPDEHVSPSEAIDSATSNNAAGDKPSTISTILSGYAASSVSMPDSMTEAPAKQPPSYLSKMEPSTTRKASAPQKTSPFEAGGTSDTPSPLAGVATKHAGPPADVTVVEVVEVTTVTAIVTEWTTVDSTMTTTTTRV